MRKWESVRQWRRIVAVLGVVALFGTIAFLERGTTSGRPSGGAATVSVPQAPADARPARAAANYGATFHGYACTSDCSGHDAGYAWAEENGITVPDDCPIDPHNSHSFTEGCWAFAGRDGPDSDDAGN